jgi:hypothetical protein
MNERLSYERIFVASFVGAIGSILTQTLVKPYIPATSVKMVGAVVFTSILIYGGFRPRLTLPRAALSLLWAVGVTYVLDKFW